MAVAEVLFWVAAGLLVYTHVGYPLVLALAARRRRVRPPAAPAELPRVSLIVAAHDEQEVIAAKVANALALDYPRGLLELIVACDGCADRTAELARGAGADLVLELPRAGKVPTQNAAVERASGELLAFSDANALWEPDALRELVAPFGDPAVGYACGQARLLDQGGSNQEGAYWRYELAVRELESSLAGVTAGNGAIYAPAAVSEEKMVATTEGEFSRKRRMMRGLYDEVVRDGMLAPRGYPAAYAWEIYSHRVLRYASPLLHLIALVTNLVLLDQGTVYAFTLAAQLLLLVAAALAGAIPIGPFRIARYYVLMTASIAAGFWDRIRHGTPGAWEKAEGTRS